MKIIKIIIITQKKEKQNKTYRKKNVSELITGEKCNKALDELQIIFVSSLFVCFERDVFFKCHTIVFCLADVYMLLLSQI